jgi:hypothetical protein
MKIEKSYIKKLDYLLLDFVYSVIGMLGIITVMCGGAAIIFLIPILFIANLVNQDWYWAGVMFLIEIGVFYGIRAIYLIVNQMQKREPNRI